MLGYDLCHFSVITCNRRPVLRHDAYGTARRRVHVPNGGIPPRILTLPHQKIPNKLCVATHIHCEAMAL